MALASRLSIYNGALAALGERRLMKQTENREARRAMDDVWDRGGVRTCLAAGQWKFAMRASKWNYNPDFTAQFGYRRAFDHPTDWVRWAGVCEDEYFAVPLTMYADEAGFLFCDLDIVYVRWVSDDPMFGMNFALWPDAFQRYVEFHFAALACIRITNDKDLKERVEKDMAVALKTAKSQDAMDEPTQFLPPGTWRQARGGRRAAVSDRGNRNQLIG